MIVLPIILALVVVGTVSFFSAYEEIEEIYDAQLSHIAKLIYSLVLADSSVESAQHYNSELLNDELEKFGHDYEKNIAFRVWKNDRLLISTKNAVKPLITVLPEGFSDEHIGKDTWRFFVLAGLQQGYRIDVAERHEVRVDLIGKILASIFSPMALLVPAVFFAFFIGLRSSLQPLDSISNAVEARTSTDLAPLSFKDVPKEIRPLVNSINELMSGLNIALEKERRFTDFAAHELRTPIAVLKIQAQAALKSTSDHERKTLLEAHVRAADRATHMVGQLLTLARLEHTDIPGESIDLGEIVGLTIQDLILLAEKKQINLRFEMKGRPRIHANRDIVSVIVRNILDNAIKYTPHGGEVTTTVTEDSSTILLSVSDNGPGIPEDRIGRVTERFYRLPGHKEIGAGLGLSIVERAAQLIKARLQIRNRSGEHGLEVTVLFERMANKELASSG